MKLDLNEMRKIAGLPLVEAADDDDDGLSASERALANKADTDLKKKGIKVPNIDPEKDMAKAAKKSTEKDDDDEKPVEKKEDTKPEPKKAEKPAPKKAEPSKVEKKPDAKKADKPAAPAPKKADAKPEPKKDETPAEAKRRGRAVNPESKGNRAFVWLKNNSSATRGQFIAHATKEFGMTHNHAATMYYPYKRKIAAAASVSEMFIITHPLSSSSILSENKMMNQYQWVDVDSDVEPLIFESEEAVNRVVRYMSEYKSQFVNVQRITFDEDEE
jgi:hypothetical protein